MRKFILALICILMVGEPTFSQTKAQKRAHRYVQHQRLLVKAIREILSDNVELYCRDLPTEECKQAKADRDEMLKIIHTVADRDSGQGLFQ